MLLEFDEACFKGLNNSILKMPQAIQCLSGLIKGLMKISLLLDKGFPR